MKPAVYIGAAIVALGAVAMFAVGQRRRPQEAVAGAPALDLAA
jgi:hypothetical protein